MIVATVTADTNVAALTAVIDAFLAEHVGQWGIVVAHSGDGLVMHVEKGPAGTFDAAGLDVVTNYYAHELADAAGLDGLQLARIMALEVVELAQDL